jgi:hypothetical protein
MHHPEFEVSTLWLAALKEMGGLTLMVSVMRCLAARDPDRNVAIIDAEIQTLSGSGARYPGKKARRKIKI